VTLLAFAAVRRAAAETGGRRDRSVSSAHRANSRKPAAVACLQQSIDRTDRWTPYRYIDPAACYASSVEMNGRNKTKATDGACRQTEDCRYCTLPSQSRCERPLGRRKRRGSSGRHQIQSTRCLSRCTGSSSFYSPPVCEHTHSQYTQHSTIFTRGSSDAAFGY